MKRRVRDLMARTQQQQQHIAAAEQQHRLEVDVLQRRLKELERDRELLNAAQESRRVIMRGGDNGLDLDDAQ